MPVTFGTLFKVGVAISLLGMFGPLGGGLVIGALICIFFLSSMGLVKLLTGALVLIGVGLPALAVAILLYVLIYCVCALTGNLRPAPLDHQEFGRDGHPIIDAEFTPVS